MGWWKVGDEDDWVGDRPADAVTLCLMSVVAERAKDGLPKPSLAELLSGLETALNSDGGALLESVAGEPSKGEVRIRLRASDLDSASASSFSNTSQLGPLEALLTQLTALYRESLERRPRVTEILACFAFVLGSGPEDYLRDGEGLSIADLGLIAEQEASTGSEA